MGNYIDDDFNILERLLGKPGRSFNNLTQLRIWGFKLKYLFSPSCARGLLQLQSLRIDACVIMEAVIGNEGEKDEDMIANVITFSQLKSLELSTLPRLLSFYSRIKKATTTESHSFPPTQSLFNEKVAFPALEELSIAYVPNIIEIWDKNLPPAESICLLRSLEVKNCEKLMNVVPSHMLPQLKSIETLEVSKCTEMEFIVILEKREEETQEATTNKDMIIVFPQLRKMEFRELENLKGVCAYKSEDQLNFNVQFPQLQKLRLENLKRLSSFNNSCAITETRPLFNHQVAFPSLEKLSIYEMPNITEIWDKNLLRPESFCLLRSLGVPGYEKLKSLKVRDCKKLMNVVPSHMFPLLKNIETLYVSECLEMEVIVVLEKREEETQETTNKDIIVFPKLMSLILEELENLKGVCAYKSEDRLCFNVQVVFPKLIIDECSLDEHTEKIFTEATSKKKECATMDASGSGMQLQP